MAKAASSTARPNKAPTATASTRRRKTPTASVGEAAESVLLQPILARLDALEKTFAAELSLLRSELQIVPEDEVPQHVDSEASLPLVADLIRRELAVHLSPVTTALRRLEERVSFVSNRLKPASGAPPPRNKTWRRETPHHNRGRDQGNARSGPAQNWTPPSAASVQDHFAPRSLRGGGVVDEEDD